MSEIVNPLADSITAVVRAHAACSTAMSDPDRTFHSMQCALDRYDIARRHDALLRQQHGQPVPAGILTA